MNILENIEAQHAKAVAPLILAYTNNRNIPVTAEVLRNLSTIYGDRFIYDMFLTVENFDGEDSIDGGDLPDVVVTAKPKNKFDWDKFYSGVKDLLPTIGATVGAYKGAQTANNKPDEPEETNYTWVYYLAAALFVAVIIFLYLKTK